MPSSGWVDDISDPRSRIVRPDQHSCNIREYKQEQLKGFLSSYENLCVLFKNKDNPAELQYLLNIPDSVYFKKCSAANLNQQNLKAYTSAYLFKVSE